MSDARLKITNKREHNSSSDSDSDHEEPPAVEQPVAPPQQEEEAQDAAPEVKHNDHDSDSDPDDEVPEPPQQPVAPQEAEGQPLQPANEADAEHESPRTPDPQTDRGYDDDDEDTINPREDSSAQPSAVSRRAQEDDEVHEGVFGSTQPHRGRNSANAAKKSTPTTKEAKSPSAARKARNDRTAPPTTAERSPARHAGHVDVDALLCPTASSASKTKPPQRAVVPRGVLPPPTPDHETGAKRKAKKKKAGADDKTKKKSTGKKSAGKAKSKKTKQTATAGDRGAPALIPPTATEEEYVELDPTVDIEESLHVAADEDTTDMDFIEQSKRDDNSASDSDDADGIQIVQQRTVEETSEPTSTVHYEEDDADDIPISHVDLTARPSPGAPHHQPPSLTVEALATDSQRRPYTSSINNRQRGSIRVVRQNAVVAPSAPAPHAGGRSLASKPARTAQQSPSVASRQGAVTAPPLPLPPRTPSRSGQSPSRGNRSMLELILNERQEKLARASSSHGYQSAPRTRTASASRLEEPVTRTAFGGGGGLGRVHVEEFMYKDDEYAITADDANGGSQYNSASRQRSAQASAAPSPSRYSSAARGARSAGAAANGSRASTPAVRSPQRTSAARQELSVSRNRASLMSNGRRPPMVPPSPMPPPRPSSVPPAEAEADVAAAAAADSAAIQGFLTTLSHKHRGHPIVLHESNANSPARSTPARASLPPPPPTTDSFDRHNSVERRTPQEELSVKRRRAVNGASRGSLRSASEMEPAPSAAGYVDVNSLPPLPPSLVRAVVTHYENCLLQLPLLETEQVVARLSKEGARKRVMAYMKERQKQMSRQHIRTPPSRSTHESARARAEQGSVSRRRTMNGSSIGGTASARGTHNSRAVDDAMAANNADAAAIAPYANDRAVRAFRALFTQQCCAAFLEECVETCIARRERFYDTQPPIVRARKIVVSDATLQPYYSHAVNRILFRMLGLVEADCVKRKYTAAVVGAVMERMPAVVYAGDTITAASDNDSIANRGVDRLNAPASSDARRGSIARGKANTGSIHSSSNRRNGAGDPAYVPYGEN